MLRQISGLGHRSLVLKEGLSMRDLANPSSEDQPQRRDSQRLQSSQKSGQKGEAEQSLASPGQPSGKGTSEAGEEALRKVFKAGKLSGWLLICKKNSVSGAWKLVYCILTPTGTLKVLKDEKSASSMELSLMSANVSIKLTNRKRGKQTSSIQFKGPKEFFLSADSPQLVWDWYTACKEFLDKKNPYQLAALQKFEPVQHGGAGGNSLFPSNSLLTARTQSGVINQVLNEYFSMVPMSYVQQLNDFHEQIAQVGSPSVLISGEALSRQTTLFQLFCDQSSPLSDLTQRSEGSAGSFPLSSSKSSPDAVKKAKRIKNKTKAKIKTRKGSRSNRSSAKIKTSHLIDASGDASTPLSGSPLTSTSTAPPDSVTTDLPAAII